MDAHVARETLHPGFFWLLVLLFVFGYGGTAAVFHLMRRRRRTRDDEH